MTSNPSSETTLGTDLDDSVVTTRVKSALLADENVKGFDISVETRKGEAHLSGLIDTQIQIDRAVQIASKIEGVKSIVNKMSIKK
jgi:hyperosmotically inducible protein